MLYVFLGMSSLIVTLQVRFTYYDMGVWVPIVDEQPFYGQVSCWEASIVVPQIFIILYHALYQYQWLLLQMYFEVLMCRMRY